MKVSLPNLNDKDFRSKKSTELLTTPSYFPALMDIAIFGHFSQFILKVFFKSFDQKFPPISRF